MKGQEPKDVNWTKWARPATAGLFLLICIISAPAIAQAHGGLPRLELSSDRLNPGATLEVRGVNIALETPITIVLVGAEAEL